MAVLFGSDHHSPTHLVVDRAAEWNHVANARPLYADIGRGVLVFGWRNRHLRRGGLECGMDTLGRFLWHDYLQEAVIVYAIIFQGYTPPGSWYAAIVFSMLLALTYTIEIITICAYQSMYIAAIRRWRRRSGSNWSGHVDGSSAWWNGLRNDLESKMKKFKSSDLE